MLGSFCCGSHSLFFFVLFCFVLFLFRKDKVEKPGFFSFGEHELGAMRPILEAHAVAIEAFCTLGLSIMEFRFFFSLFLFCFLKKRKQEKVVCFWWIARPIFLEIVPKGSGIAEGSSSRQGDDFSFSFDFSDFFC